MSSLLDQYFFIANQATTTFFSKKSISASPFKKLSHYLTIFLHIVTTLIVIGFPVVGAIEDDVQCLKGVKASLKDPLGKLASWNFSNAKGGFICGFAGGSCWNEWENRLFSLEVRSMGLVGEIPDSLQFCSSINLLDLSENELTGGIPANICTWLPFLVRLDLSGNKLSGPIPGDLFKCRFLNTLNLNDNHLAGTIPYQLSDLRHLRRLSLANNRLHGEIPTFLSTFDPKYFEGNPGLCGHPLRKECRVEKRSLSWFFVSAMYGFVIGFWSVLAVLYYCMSWRIRYFRFIDKICCSWLLERYALWILYLRDQGF